jgi:hypothetical protein
MINNTCNWEGKEIDLGTKCTPYDASPSMIEVNTLTWRFVIIHHVLPMSLNKIISKENMYNVEIG